MSPVNGENFTVSNYLLQRLDEAGIKHLFGVPGDYVLDFLDAVIGSPLKWVGNCNELNAGYAADGYARLTGLGAAVVTYGVGGLSILNAVAGAYAERVPMIIISGAPPGSRRESGALVHHLISGYDLQLDIFKKVTIDAVILRDAGSAPAAIDRVISNAILHKLPVYIELPADIAVAQCEKPGIFPEVIPPPSNDAALNSAIRLAADKINNAENPVVLAGIELQRFGLGSDLLRLVEHAELPFSTMLSSKSVLPELHPQFIGIYQGGWSRETVRNQVEQSDCILSAGVWMTDLDTGMFSGSLNDQQMIIASNNNVHVNGQGFQNVQLVDFIRGLMPKIEPRLYSASHPLEVRTVKSAGQAEIGRPLTALRLYEQINCFLDDQMILMAEPGDAFCAALDFQIEEAENFIVQAFYSSIGFCTAAALGVSFARPGKRPVVLTGDGAFQMTAQEISTLIRNRCPAIVLLINNDGYLIERELHEDGPYNDIQMWNYADLPAAFGNGDFALGLRVKTEDELASALKMASGAKDRFIFLEIVLADRSCSAGLKQLGDTFRKVSKAK